MNCDYVSPSLCELPPCCVTTSHCVICNHISYHLVSHFQRLSNFLLSVVCCLWLCESSSYIQAKDRGRCGSSSHAPWLHHKHATVQEESHQMVSCQHTTSAIINKAGYVSNTPTNCKPWRYVPSGVWVLRKMHPAVIPFL